MVVVSAEGDLRYYNKAQAEAQKKKRRRSQEVAAVESHFTTATRPGMNAPPNQVDAAPAAVPMPWPDPTEQLKMIDRAYVGLHGTHPKSDLAAMLLINMPMGRSEDDYRALFAPGLLTGENPMAPTGPGGISELGLMAQGQRPLYKIFAVDGDVPTMGNIHPFVPGEGDKTLWGHKPTGEVDAYAAANTINTLRSLRRESNDGDRSTYDQLEHDMLMRDWTSFLSTYGERYAADGGNADWDAEDGVVTEKGIAAYASYVFDRLQADYMIGDDAQQAKAITAMDKVAGAAFGARAPEILAAMKQNQVAFKESGVPDDQLLDTVYRSFLRGRGLNQTEKQARWDYIERYGRDYLPTEGAAKAAEESTSFADVLDKTLGSAFRGLGTGLEAGVHAAGEKVNPLDWLIEGVKEHAPGRMGEIAGTLDSWNASLFEGAGKGAKFVGEMGPLMYGISYAERAAVTLESVVSAAGLLTIPDITETITGQDMFSGEGNYPEDLSTADRLKASVKTLASISEWKRGWDEGEGRMVVEYGASQVCDDFGLDRDNPYISTFIAGLDLYVACKLGSKADVVVRAGMRVAPKAMLGVGRAVYDIPRNLGGSYRGSKLAGQEGFLNLGSDRVKGALAKMTPDERAETLRLNEEAVGLEQMLSDQLAGDTSAATIPSKDILGRVRELGIDDTSPESLAKKFGINMNPTERSRLFKGTLVNQRNVKNRGPGRSMDDVAKTIGEEFPGSGIADAEGLYDFLSNHKPPKKVTEKRAAQPDMARLETLADELARRVDEAEARAVPERVGPVEELADGGRVRNVEGVGKIDASIAVDIARVNDEFAPTKGSHSAFPDDHGPKSAAMRANAPPYIEFEAKALRRKKGAIAKVRALDGDSGLKVIAENGLIRIEGKTTGDIVYAADVLTGRREGGGIKGAPPKTDVEYAEQYVNEGPEAGNPELTPGDLRGTGVRGPEGPPPELPLAKVTGGEVPLEQYRRYPKWLQTTAEAIAEHFGEQSEAAIAKTLSIDNVPEWRDALTKLGKAKTPQQVMKVMEDYDLEIDPMMPGIFRTVRFRNMVEGNHARTSAMERIFGTMVALDDKMPLQEAHIHVAHLGYAFKMGMRKLDAAAIKRINHWSQKMWEANSDGAKMQRILGRLDKENIPEKGSFYREVYDNMGPKEWEKFITFRQRMLAGRGRSWLGVGHRRGYGMGDDVVPAAYRRQIAAEKKALVKRATKTEDPATVKQIERDLTEAQRLMDKYDDASRIVNDQKGTKKMTLQEAETYMDSLAHPEPLAHFQMRQGLQHPVDPRMLTWFMTGDKSAKGLRTLLYSENVTLRPATQIFKLIALGTLGFPIRVLAGDEFTRLIPEGIGVGARIPGARDWVGKNRYVEAKRTVEAMRNDGRLLKVSDDLYERLHSDFLTEYSDDFRVVAPEELGTIPRGWAAMGDFMRKMRNEPIVEEWFKSGDERPTTESSIRQFVIDQLSREDDVGAGLRELLVNTQRLTERQVDLKVLRRLLSHPETRVGAAGNLNRFLSSWTDTLGKIGNDEALFKVFRDRDFNQAVIERIDPKKLWAIPVKESFNSKLGGRMSPGYWASRWYEGIPTGRLQNIPGLGRAMPSEIGVMPLLAKLTNQMREAFFGDAYNKEIATLKAKGMTDMVQMNDIASSRAMAYVNRVTYVRNATIFEDLTRNVVPFINSYRQFALYWAKAFAQHPFAMSAFYMYDPLKGQLAQQFGNTQFFLPAVPFWIPQTTEDDNAVGFIRNMAPTTNPFIGMTVGALLRGAGIESDIEQVPGLGSTSRNWSPFGRLSRVLAAYGLFIGPFGVEEGKIRREHLEILKAIGKAPDGPWGVDDEVQVEYPLSMKVGRWLGMEYPEQAFQFLASTFTPLSQKYNPEQKAIVDRLRLNMRTMNPLQLAQYRSENPKADQLAQVWSEQDMEKRNLLVAKWPWTEPYIVSTYDYSQDDGRWIPTMADRIAKVAEGRIKLVATDEEFFRAWERKHVTIFGGWQRNKNTGNIEFTAPPKDSAAALEVLKTKTRAAKLWARSASRELAGGSKDLAKQLYEDWERGVEDPDSGLRMPSAFEALAEREGKNPADYNVAALTAAYEEDYGEIGAGQTYGMSETTKKAVATLIQEGLMGPGYKLAFESISSFAPDIKKAREDLVVERRKAIVSPATQEFYDLDGLTLAKMVGISPKLAPGLDRVRLDVQNYYYNVYQPIKDKYGSSSREGREAKLEFDKYRDKTFGGVKGGEYFVGGAPERILNIKYFNHPKMLTVATGKTSLKQEQLWTQYVAEARKKQPDMKLLDELHDHFGKTNESNWNEIMRVNHMVYTAGMAHYYRTLMKESYSEYYQGPGNSTLTKLGKHMVANLRTIIKGMIEDDGGAKTSLYAQDIETYFGGVNSFSSSLCEWSYH